MPKILIGDSSARGEIWIILFFAFGSMSAFVYKEDNIQSTNNKKLVVIGLKCGQILHLTGIVNVRLYRGRATVYGASLTGNYVSLASPKWGSALGIHGTDPLKRRRLSYACELEMGEERDLEFEAERIGKTMEQYPIVLVFSTAFVNFGNIDCYVSIGKLDKKEDRSDTI